MSTFSSVINKSSKKFTPRAAPRRNAQRSAQALQPQAPPSVTSSRPNLSTNPEIPASAHAETSTAPTSDLASSSSTPSAVNTRSTSIDAGPDNNQKGPESAPLVQIQKRSGSKPSKPHERTTAIIRSGEDTVIEQSREIPVVRVSAPTGTKRKQPEQDVPEGTETEASPSSPAITKKTAPPRKKRKTTPTPAPIPISTATRATPSSPSSRRVSASPSNNPGPSSPRMQQTEAFLQNATRQAATVSALADAIDVTTNSSRRGSRTRKQSSASVPDPVASVVEPETPRTRRPRKSRTRESTLQAAAAEIVADALRGADDSPRRRRKHTPEGAEDHEIDSTVVKMGDLVNDDCRGKKSTREARMQEVDWDEVKKQRKEAALESQKRRETHEKEKNIAARAPNETATAILPTMEVVDGNIIIIESSREVDRQAEAVELQQNPNREVREENDVTKRVNQRTVGRQKGIGPGTRWDDEMDSRFYRGLRMFGTDFMMISNMFPGLTRRHIKLKFVKEEKLNYNRVKRNLEDREPVDLEEFEEMTDKVLQDPKIVQEEIEEQEKRLREEDDLRRANEDGQPHSDEDGDIVLPSREPASAEPEERRSDGEDAPVEESTENRFAAAARNVVEAAIAPKKKQRKQTAAAKKKEAAKRGKRHLEGVEERLGPIDEVSLM